MVQEDRQTSFQLLKNEKVDRGMHPQSNNSRCAFWRKPQQMGKVCIQRHQHTALPLSKLPHYRIGSTGHSKFRHPNHRKTLIPQSGADF